jgi:ABC-type phosphate transport system substrate-binding protein
MNLARFRLLLAIAILTLLALPTTSAAAAPHALIQGSGSSWSANAVNQWVADVQSSGLSVVYTPSGSAQGRHDFAYKTTDFAVSDIGYQGTDPVTGENDTSLGRTYAYLPIVAGGTSFPYQIKVGGKLVRNLRLSGLTLAKIFTNQITNWSDSAITADNNGRKLPSLPIIPVVHSEGSGSTAQFTQYLNSVYPSLWRPFLGKNTGTEYYPRKGRAIAQNGSDRIMSFVSSDAANGSIGYDEYSYPLGKNYPVAKILNSAGYYTLPNQYNVAVALTRAVINGDTNSPNYLLQDLHNVYVYGDRRTYPLSSYSYAIIPIAANDQKMTTAKRQTIVDFLFYSVCGGQKEMGPIGYSPLPLNLVTASFAQTSKLHTADAKVDVTHQAPTSCDNPTFDKRNPGRNYLAEIAPYPPTCDKQGQGPCGATIDPGTANPGPNGAPPTGSNGGSAGTGGTGGSGAGSGGTGSSGGGAGSGSGATGGTHPSAAGSTRGAAPASHIDPDTGQIVTDGPSSGNGDASLASAELARGQQGNLVPYSVAVVVLLGAALLAPPLISARLRSRDKP